ncbi:hypothetical protein MRX96_036322 [Rhipicephalus microplus]
MDQRGARARRCRPGSLLGLSGSCEDRNCRRQSHGQFRVGEVTVDAAEEAGAAATIRRLPGSDGNIAELFDGQELGQTSWRRHVCSHDVSTVTHTAVTPDRLASVATSVKRGDPVIELPGVEGVVEYSPRHCKIGRNGSGLQYHGSPPGCLPDDRLVVVLGRRRARAKARHDDRGVARWLLCSRSFGLAG